MRGDHHHHNEPARLGAEAQKIVVVAHGDILRYIAYGKRGDETVSFSFFFFFCRELALSVRVAKILCPELSRDPLIHTPRLVSYVH